VDFTYAFIAVGVIALGAWVFGSKGIGTLPKATLKQVWSLIKEEKLCGEIVGQEAEGQLVFQHFLVTGETLILHYRKAVVGTQLLERADLEVQGHEDTLVLEWYGGAPICKRQSRESFSLEDLDREDEDQAELLLRILRSTVSS
jgi:hypothetical protein